MDVGKATICVQPNTSLRSSKNLPKKKNKISCSLLEFHF